MADLIELSPSNPPNSTNVLSATYFDHFPIEVLRALASHVDFELRCHLYARLFESRREVLVKLGVTKLPIEAETLIATGLKNDKMDRLLLQKVRDLEHVGLIAVGFTGNANSVGTGDESARTNNLS